jgi:hypothetical protein
MTTTRYYWLLLASSGSRPRVVQSLAPGVTPLGFHLVEAGMLGPVVSTHAGVLVSPRLGEAIRGHLMGTCQLISALVASPQGNGTPEPYFLLRPAQGIPLADTTSPSTAGFTLAFLSEAPESVVVSAPLRIALEAERIPGLTFQEPLFAA